MRNISKVLIAIIAISVPALAQCSTLAVTGSINAGQTVAIDVSGAAAHAIAFVAVGDAGSSTIQLPGSTLSLGVAQPYILFPLGMTDASGHVALSVAVPANIPANLIQNHTYAVQALVASFTMGMPPSFSVCVSNVASLISGTG